MSNSIANQIFFLDANVTDYERLLAQLPVGADVHILDSSSDALTQIAAALQGHSGIEAVHLVSHGSAGTLALAGGDINLATLDDATHTTALESIRASLTDSADFLLYGCNVAEGDAGNAFITKLADLTGADVAASTDLSGPTNLGGNSTLESSTGLIEANSLSLDNLNEVLASGSLHNGYIRFGYSDDGTLGVGGNAKPGIQYDPTGTGTFLDTADSLTPGTPRESFSIKIGSSVYSNRNEAYTSPQIPGSISVNAITSGSHTYGTVTSVNSIGGLQITQVYTLSDTDTVINMQVSVKNTTGSTINGVQYSRGTDPDVDSNGLAGATSSTNNTRGSGSISGNDIVLAEGPTSHRIIGYYSGDAMSHNTSVSNTWSMDPSVALSGNNNGNGDYTINIGFDLGNISAGQIKSFSFAYIFVSSPAQIAAVVASVPASNPVPTLTAFDAPLVTVNEDTQAPITFADLAAHGNEADLNADATPGTVAAFVIKGVTTGSLKIGANAGSATAWSAGSNDSIPADGSKNLYWTPAANANGTLNAFTAIARDAEGAVSATPIQVQVAVTPVNDAPVIAANGTAVTLAAINEDPASNAGATVASLFTPRFTDVDAGAALGGIIVVSNSNATGGTWQYSVDGSTWHNIGAVSASNALALSASTHLRFLPDADWNGVPTPLSIYLTDNTYSGGYSTDSTADYETSVVASGVSSNTVDLGTTVNAINDLPTFTSVAGAATLTETSAYDSSFTTASGALTGTLTGTDVEDGSSVTFGIRGGDVSGSTVTKNGFYGNLVLNTSTNAWTYTPTNNAAINALAEGKTVTEAFDFKVIDTAGASSIQPLVISLTGTNDVPLLGILTPDPIPNQIFNGSGAWSYQIPAGIFTDAEGTNLTYSVQVVDGSLTPSAAALAVLAAKRLTG
ncbi:MAG: DUF4347 domain-containing protein [Methylococcales bacterium]|nr:DUF4347 domain-containing protein [Methylococcales bacterium]